LEADVTARQRRLGSLALALALVLAIAGLGVGLSAPASAELPALVVPDAPTGDTVVTASADPAEWPYLQVKLGHSGTFAPPYEAVDAIDPAPAVNDGSPVSITVPTWGLADVDGVFVLLGCSTGDPATCATLLASEARRVTQSVVATAALEVPTEPVFIPEEQVRIRVDNPGGGEMRAGTGYRTSEQRLANHATTVYDAFPDTSGRVTLRVNRCSALAGGNYCEQPVALQVLTIVKRVVVQSVFGQSVTRLTVDPAWHASTAHPFVYGPRMAYDLSWSLFDRDGVRVVGPVTAPTSASGVDEPDFSPGAHATGRLPDGAYTARFTATVTKGDLARSGSAETTIELVNDPPADDPRLLSAYRRLRDRTFQRYPAPRFLVQAYPGSSRDGMLRLRDRSGAIIASRRVSNPCWFGSASCADPVWDADFAGFGTLNNVSAGFYQAELEMPDSYGRMMVRRLGRVVADRSVPITRTVDVGAAGAAVAGRPGKRTFVVRIPAVRALQYVAELGVAVREAHRAPRGRTAIRVPALSTGWERGNPLAPRRGWSFVGSVSPWLEPRPEAELQGAAVRVRVSGADASHARIDRIRLRTTFYAWRPPKA
jgi:hypothetical protein